MMDHYIKKIAGVARDLIYPPDLYCICCGKIIDHTRTYRLCNECMAGIKWVTDRTCVKCGKRLSENDPLEICFNCREHEHSFDHGYTCAEYGTHERALVFSLKYDGRTDIADTISEIMYDRMTAKFTPEELRQRYDLILPVPVHISKLRTRGFNQAALIAGGFSSRTGIPYDDTILRRERETHVMKSLDPDQRRENIRDAFGIRQWRIRDLEGKKLLLIDDIYTTGATIDEISGIVREAGAERIDFLTFASGADMVKA